MTEKEFQEGLLDIAKRVAALYDALGRGGLFGTDESKFSMQQCIDVGQVSSFTEEESIKFYHYYNRQGWKFGNGLPITDLASAMINWRVSGYKDKYGAKPEKKEDKSVCYWCGKNSDGEKRLTPFDMYKAEDHAFCGKWHYDLWVRKGRPEK